jgi:hypothetical protein
MQKIFEAEEESHFLSQQKRGITVPNFVRIRDNSFTREKRIHKQLIPYKQELLRWK